MGVSWADRKFKKRHFEALFSLILWNKELFLSWTVVWNEKWILYNKRWPAEWLDQEEAPNTSQSLICTKESSWLRCGALGAHVIHYSFLNLGKTIKSERYTQQIDGMYQKLQCLQPALGNRKGPILLHDNAWPHAAQSTLQKLNKFASSAVFTWPLAKWLPLQVSQQLFAGTMLPQPARGRKCFLRVHRIPKHRCLCYRNKQIYFSLAKVCWL